MKIIALVIAGLIVAKGDLSPSEAVGGIKGSLKNGFNAHQYLKSKKGVVLVSPEEFQYSTQEIAEITAGLSAWAFQNYGMPLLIGDMSLKAGGKIARHRAHQNGLEVDIGYLPKKSGAIGHRHKKYHNRFPESFSDGEKLSANFDRNSNFKLFHQIFENYDVAVILLSCPVKRAYLQWPDRELNVVKKIVVKPAHEDHFHLRIKCPKGDAECSDELPVKVFKDIKCDIQATQDKQAAPNSSK